MSRINYNYKISVYKIELQNYWVKTSSSLNSLNNRESTLGRWIPRNCSMTSLNGVRSTPSLMTFRLISRKTGVL